MNEEEILNTVPEHELATVSQVMTTGLKLIFDGEEESDGKIYKCNSAVNFKAGERVRVAKIAKTYIVEFPIGNTSSKYPIPSGGTDGQYLVKDGVLPHALKWKSLSASGLLPEGGAAGQYLKKTAAADYACEWAAISVSGTLPAGGTTGQYLRKTSSTAYACEWAAISVSGTLPTGGTTGQYLRKTSSTNYACEWSTPPVTGTSSTIGFMGTPATAKQTVLKLLSSATLATTITKVNDLLTALNKYGLITSA